MTETPIVGWNQGSAENFQMAGFGIRLYLKITGGPVKEGEVVKGIAIRRIADQQTSFSKPQTSLIWTTPPLSQAIVSSWHIDCLPAHDSEKTKVQSSPWLPGL